MRPADAALAGSCAAFVLVPTLGPLLSDGEGYDTGPQSPIAPPGYAFGVWFPIFAACAADTVGRVRQPQEGDEATRWPLVAAYAGNTAWALLAQTDHYRPTPAVLSAAAASSALAVRRLEQRGAGRGTTPVAAGLLLGWTMLASAVNVTTEARRSGLVNSDPLATPLDVAALVAAAGAPLAVVRRRGPGVGAVTTTATWGLATTAVTSQRPAGVRALAAVAAAALVAAVTRPTRG
ncbi:hypothetical protein [uncultured Nocardioides sp.]|uniref:hypothetical protein n=1 Tax=uncultured Nocardioides sp. TaxID=198441 RepID=UPI00262670F6|nr:hypothetical protein [uncultured Nocardioides sp.]